MYLVEGNIGVGKSTFLRLMQAHIPDIQILFEPVDAWSNSTTSKSLLSNFYTDTPRWSYTMETFTMFARIKNHLDDRSMNTTPLLAERSLYSGYYCFAKNGFEQGQMETIEWLLYSQWFDFLTSALTPPRGFIYLKSNPAVCHARTSKRSRSGENGISLAYFEQIHERHEDFLIKKHGVCEMLENVPVLTLDASCEFESDLDARHEYADYLKRFIEVTSQKDA